MPPKKQKKALPDIPLPDSARAVLEKRYLQVDSKGKPKETFSDLLQRVSKNIASGDKKYGAKAAEVRKTEEQFFEMQAKREFLSGMCLRNAGREMQQLAACYVLPLQDSMESIYTTLKDAAFLHKTGAGIGYDFSELRPRGDLVKTTGKVSSGPVSFMKLINFSCETIVNNAAVRGAGNMGILRVDHSDIEEFITAKSDMGELKNFNLSVAITDEFMKAVKTEKEYAFRNPRTGRKVAGKDAKTVWRLIAERAWSSAEPGVLFIDTVNKENQVPGIGKISATNQCGEQPLLPYESCNLGSIVLSRFVNEGEKPAVDWDRLAEVVRLATRFLDNTIDMNTYILPQIEEIVLGNRRVGLGVMGFADMLYKLGIPYSSPEAVKMAEKTMRFVTDVSRNESQELAKKRGNFPNFRKSVWPKKGFKKMRNVTTTTIAPTGTTSMFADCSSGIEPVFSLAYVRKNIMNVGATEKAEGEEFVEVNSIFEKVAKERWFYSQELMDRVAREGSIKHIEEIPEDVRNVFETTYDIPWQQHIKIQAAFQKYTDNAVSKTINMPESATVEEIEEAYTMLYETGCKGGTIYRDKSRDKQVLNLKEDKKVVPTKKDGDLVHESHKVAA